MALASTLKTIAVIKSLLMSMARNLLLIAYSTFQLRRVVF
jgi:hypothetical protein